MEKKDMSRYDDIRRNNSIVKEKREPQNRSTQGRPIQRPEHRPPQRTNSGNRRPVKKPFFNKRFKRVLKWIGIVALVLLVIEFIWFYSFMASYEKGRPYYVMNDLKESFNEDDIAKYLKDYITDDNSFDSVDTIISRYTELIAGKDITYEEDTEYREDAPVYLVKADGETVAKVKVESVKKKLYGFNKWEISDIYIADYLPDTQSITITAEEGTTVKVNGVTVADKYITKESGVPVVLESVQDYLSTIPSVVTYEIGGLIEEPTVTAQDAQGNEIDVKSGEDSYAIGYAASDEFISNVSDRVDTVLTSYGYYFINVSTKLSGYLLPDSQLATDVASTVTYFYANSKMSGYSYSKKNISNYVQYSDECFTCDVSYKLDVSFVSDRYSDDNQAIDATWVFIKQNGTWYLADCINK